MRRALALLLACAALLLGGCGSAQDSPEHALASLQEALRGNDLPAVLALHDAESRAYFRQLARERRAADGAEDARYREGDLDDAAALACVELGQLFEMRKWLETATVLGREMRAETDGRNVATLKVRTSDGAERTVHFLLEPEGWTFDAFRHYQESLNRR